MIPQQIPTHTLPLVRDMEGYKLRVKICVNLYCKLEEKAMGWVNEGDWREGKRCAYNCILKINMYKANFMKNPRNSKVVTVFS